MASSVEQRSRRTVQGRVSVAGATVPLAVLRSRPERFTARFDRARHTVGYAVCECTDPGQPLVIRRRGAVFHLACWPHRGHHHHPGCAFFRPDPALTGRSGYHLNAVRETEHGTWLRMRDPLELRSAAATDGAPRPRAGTPGGGAAQDTMSLLGVLHYLWEHARLNIADDETSSWTECRRRLVDAAGDIVLNGTALGCALHVVAPYRPSTATDTAAELASFRRRLGHHENTELIRRGLILGEIKQIDPTRYGHAVRLRHLGPPLFVADELLSGWQHTFPVPFASTRPERARRILLALIDRTARDNLRIAAGAAMTTTEGYLPVESAPELAMATHLAEAGRRFLKPVRYDHHDEVFPDFVLLDTEPVTYVEVWGVTGREDYEHRRATKRDIYRRRGAALLEWSVGDPLPNLDVASASST